MDKLPVVVTVSTTMLGCIEGMLVGRADLLGCKELLGKKDLLGLLEG